MRIGKRYVALFLAGVMTATAVSVQGGVAEGSTIETECSQVSENKAEDTENLQDGVYRVTFDGSNTRKEIQSALNLIRDGVANKLEITLRGNIQIDGGLVVYSNTTIDATGATIEAKRSNGTLLASATAKYYGTVPYADGYQKTQNIKIIGGTWDGKKSIGQVIRFVHSSNVELDGLTVKNCKDSGHVITFEGVKQATVKNCTVIGQEGMVSSKEAIHFDIVHSTQTTPDLISSEYDDLPCKDITITNNIIKDAPNAIGSHGAVQGVYHQNIVISDNQISDISNVALPIFNYRNVTISGNIINDVSKGIKVFTYQNVNDDDCKRPLANATLEADPVKNNYQIVIRDNMISGVTGGYPLQVQGSPKRRMAGVTVENNTISGKVKGIGILAEYLTGGVITGNKIAAKKNETIDIGFSLNCAQNVEVTGNTIGSASTVGIRIQNKSHNAKITGNVISNIKKVGIYALDSRLSIEKNTLSDISGDALCIWNAGKNMKIRKNSLKNVKGIGIGLNATKNACITENEIEGVKGNVINLNSATANVQTRKMTVVDKVSAKQKIVSGKAVKGSKYQVIIKGKKYNAAVKSGKFETSKIKAIKARTKVTVVETITGKNKLITTTKAR